MIDENLFDSIYKNTVISEYKNIFYSLPKNDKEFISSYLSSKLWRLNNLYTIVNKKGRRIKFDMNVSQHKVYKASLEHPRLIILKSRQQGISTLWLVSFFDDCLFNNDFSSGLMAQGADEAETLLQRTKILWNELDDSIKNFLGLKVIKDNTKEFSLNNNSSIFVRTSFRSTTLQRLHISEFGKIANKYPERARETKTGTLQAIAAGNTTVIESTAEGDNSFKQMWDNSMAYASDLTAKDFKPVFLSWLDDPDCVLSRDQIEDANASSYFSNLEKTLGLSITKEQRNFWIAQYRELGKDIYQEYPATPEEAFLKDRDGTYYALLYLNNVRNKNREVDGLFDPSLPVHVAIDLGRNDLFVMLFFQCYSDGWRIIDVYSNTGLGIKHYCEVLDELSSTKEYNYGTIVLPHDAAVRDLTSNETREEAFWKYGYNNTDIIPRTKDINQDIELVRQALKNTYIDKKCQYVIDCYLNYSKEWDAKRGIWRNTPQHDNYSHGADAIRQMVRSGLNYTSSYNLNNTSGFDLD